MARLSHITGLLQGRPVEPTKPRANIYVSRFEGRDGKTYQLEVLYPLTEGQSVGKEIEVRLGADAPVILSYSSDSKISPIVGASCEVNLYSDKEGMYRHLLDYPDGAIEMRLYEVELVNVHIDEHINPEYYVSWTEDGDIEERNPNYRPDLPPMMRYKRTSTLWCGVVDMESYEEPYDKDTGYMVRLVASDFGHLKRIPVSLTGVMSLDEVVIQLAPRLRYTQAYEYCAWRDAGDGYSGAGYSVASTLSALYASQPFVDTSVFYTTEGAMSCYDALEAVLFAHASRIEQRGGVCRTYRLSDLMDIAPVKLGVSEVGRTLYGAERYDRVELRSVVTSTQPSEEASIDVDPSIKAVGIQHNDSIGRINGFVPAYYVASEYDSVTGSSRLAFSPHAVNLDDRVVAVYQDETRNGSICKSISFSVGSGATLGSSAKQMTTLIPTERFNTHSLPSGYGTVVCSPFMGISGEGTYHYSLGANTPRAMLPSILSASARQVVYKLDRTPFVGGNYASALLLKLEMYVRISDAFAQDDDQIARRIIVGGQTVSHKEGKEQRKEAWAMRGAYIHARLLAYNAAGAAGWIYSGDEGVWVNLSGNEQVTTRIAFGGKEMEINDWVQANETGTYMEFVDKDKADKYEAPDPLFGGGRAISSPPAGATHVSVEILNGLHLEFADLALSRSAATGASDAPYPCGVYLRGLSISRVSADGVSVGDLTSIATTARDTLESYDADVLLATDARVPASSPSRLIDANGKAITADISLTLATSDRAVSTGPLHKVVLDNILCHYVNRGYKIEGIWRCLGWRYVEPIELGGRLYIALNDEWDIRRDMHSLTLVPLLGQRQEESKTHAKGKYVLSESARVIAGGRQSSGTYEYGGGDRYTGVYHPPTSGYRKPNHSRQ